MILKALFVLCVSLAILFWALWLVRPRRRAVDQARVDREMWGELLRLRDRAAGLQSVEPLAGAESAEASGPGLAVERVGDPGPAPRQLGRKYIHVVKPPRQSFVPWDGKTH